MTKKYLSALKCLCGYVVCVSGFLLSLAAFYPGYMSEDSVGQWTQGRSWNFTDIHPPLMSALWGLADKIYPGPFGMLLLHNAVFWGAAALYWKTTRRKSWWLGIGLISCGFMPQLWPLLGIIWKDVGLGAALLLTSALLYAANKTRALLPLLLSLPFLFYAYAARWNAAPAVLPFAVWTGFIVARMLGKGQSNARSGKALPLVGGLIYFIALTLGVAMATKVLTHGATEYPSQQILLHDLAAISHETGEAQFPDYIIADPTFSQEKALGSYSYTSVNPLIYSIPPALKLSTDASDIATLRAKWLEVVPTHKMIYLKHRWALFSKLLGFKTDYVYNAYLESIFLNPAAHKPHRTMLDQYVRSYVEYFRATFLFKGYFWLALSTGLVYLSLRGKLHEDLEVVFVLALSGTLFSLAYFFIAPSSEPRYLWWTMLSSIVALVFFVHYFISSWSRLRAAETTSLTVTL